MRNYENSTEVGRREGLTEGELRTMGMLAMEATEELKKTTIRKEAVLLGSVPFGSWDEFAKAVQEMAAHSYEPIPVKINTKLKIKTKIKQIQAYSNSIPR